MIKKPQADSHIDIGLFDDIEPDVTLLNSEKPNPDKKRSHRRTTAVVDIPIEDEYRRAFGAQELIRIMGLKRPERGHSIHIITGGNVDLICHVKWLLLHFPVIKTVFISAWTISASDIVMARRWVESGKVQTLSLLVGDVYPSKYKNEWKVLIDLYNKGVISNLYSATIHSKLILIETQCGEYICVESSANCNMNPRVEQSVVTVSKELYEFYTAYMSDIFQEQQYKRINLDLQKLELTTGLFNDTDSDFSQG